MAVRELDIPRTLPGIEHFSVSKLNLYLNCPEKFRRRYLEREYEPPSPALILGSSVHAAEAQADHAQIDTGARLSTQEVQDAFSDEWEDRSEREEVAWGDEKPGDVKDVGIRAVAAYDRDIAPSLRPVTSEREFSLDLADVDWKFLGYIDLEEEDGAVVDRKVRGSKLAKGMADADIQPAAYLVARRAEGNPSPAFRYHTFVKVKNPYAEVVPTVRTDRQLDAFVNRLYDIAAELHWRMQTDVWAGAVPGSWVCSERWCGFWPSCSMGGLR